MLVSQEGIDIRRPSFGLHVTIVDIWPIALRRAKDRRAAPRVQGDCAALAWSEMESSMANALSGACLNMVLTRAGF
jgi:hypothetical protein